MVIVPIGACEQHGPHLPLAVDTIDCYEVAKRVSARTGVPVIPPVTYGCSQSHGDFPGTLSIRPETMMRMICDIVEWLYRGGIGKILLLNGHMWNWGPIYSARENIHYDFPDIQVRVLDWWAAKPDIMTQSVKDCPVLLSYVHANIGKTSCMLAVRPDLVNMADAVDEKDYEHSSSIEWINIQSRALLAEKQLKPNRNSEKRFLQWLSIILRQWLKTH